MENKILDLASLCLDFGRVERKTAHQDGVTPESDTDHTFMLGIMGISVASNLYPSLDMGKIAQFALVHDLVEVYAGDTPTLVGMNEDLFKDKERREVEAMEKIKDKFHTQFPWIYERIREYESLDTQEARFVKVLDKILPKITLVLNNAKSLERYDFVVKRSEVEKTFNVQREKIKKISEDMPELIELWEYFAKKELDLIQ